MELAARRRDVSSPRALRHPLLVASLACLGWAAPTRAGPAGPRPDDEDLRVEGIDTVAGRFTGSLQLRPAPGGRVKAELVRSLEPGTEQVLLGVGAWSASRLSVRLDPDGARPLELLLEPAAGGDLAGSLTGLGVSATLTARPWSFTRETQLAAGSPTRLAIEAHARSAQEGAFLGEDGFEVRWAAWLATPERGAVVFVPGRGESYRKYAELAWDLRGSGYSLYLLDPRGQGLSERLLGRGHAPGSAAWQRHHVSSFGDYLRDLRRFLELVVNRVPHRRLLAWGHSMGAAVLLRYAQHHPGTFQAIVAGSPMCRLPLSSFERRVVWLQVFFGRGHDYARGKGPYDPDADTRAGDRTTSSAARWAVKHELLAADRRLWTGGPTWGWVAAALEGSDNLRSEARRLRDPVLLFQAGEDGVVDGSGQDAVAREAPRCRLVPVPGARHDLLNEADPIRRDVLTQALRFLDLHSR